MSAHTPRQVLALIAVWASAAAAQAGPGEARAASKVPASALPPAGLCRVWLKDVPAGQQPAPTDCASAIRRAPPSATILFGSFGKEATVRTAPRPGTAAAGARADESPSRTPVAPLRSTPRSGREPTGPSRTIAPAGGAKAGQAAPAIHPAPPPPPPAKPPEKPQS